MKFKIGDMVVAVDNDNEITKKGCVGKVVAVKDDSLFSILVTDISNMESNPWGCKVDKVWHSTYSSSFHLLPIKEYIKLCNS